MNYRKKKNIIKSGERNSSRSVQMSIEDIIMMFLKNGVLKIQLTCLYGIERT